MAKHLIMGFGTNQSPESLRVFLKSARSVYPREECDVALITNTTKGLEEIVEEAGAIVLNTPSTYSNRVSKLTKVYNRAFLQSLRGLARSGALARSPEIEAGYHQLIETWHHPHFARWFAYGRVMRTFVGYDKILLADTKDVVFQARVFDGISSDAVAIFEDGEDLRPEGWNGRWYIEAFGRKAHDEVAARQPICIGVIAGGAGPLLRVVTELCAEIARKPFGRIEQSVFNKMYFHGEFSAPLRTFPNVEGPVLTMAGEVGEARVAWQDGLVRDAAGARVFPVVHMYDRFPSVRDAVLARYP